MKEHQKSTMKPRPAKGFTEIAGCTFCGSRNILKPPIVAGSRCAVCKRILEFRSDIECPHCQVKSIHISMGRDPEAGHFLMCSGCNRQIADGIPLGPEFARFPVWTLRLVAGIAARLAARLFNAAQWYQYQPKLARAQFQDLRASWRSESYTREKERQGQRRPRENDLTVYARADEGEQIKRSRQIVLSRHTALMDKYRQYISTFVPLAHGKIYQDEYGDEIWAGAEREIERIIDDKVFKRENIRDRDEFYSFEFLSRCEPAFESEYSDCWIFDELKDRLKVYHQTHLRTLAAGGIDPDKRSGTEFEQWLIASIRQAGIVDAKPTKRTGDQGADIIVRHGRTIVIQAKCYQQSVGNSAVQEVHAAKIHYAADEAWVVTNSTFTRSARELAKSTVVRLVDRSSFRDIGSLITQAIASEDQRLPAEPHSSESAVSGDLRSASESSNPARETEPVPESALTLIAPSCATPPPSDPPGLSPADSQPKPSRRYELPQTAAGIVAAKSRRVSSSIALILLVGSSGYLLMSHYSRERVEQRVRGVLAVWTSTILSNDLAGQVDCYAPTVAPFFQRPSATIQEVAAEKERVMKTYPLVKKYAISNISFEHADANKVVVSFDKSWEAHGRRTFAGSERQSLELRPLGGRWRIIAERELQIYWVRTK